MRVESLYLRGFRNYEEASVSFAPGINLICGPNAQGKMILGSAYANLATCLTMMHRYDEAEGALATSRQLYPDAELVEQGSSYKFCLLAEGSIDYYPRTSNTYEWDTAAGEVILSEAGGVTKALPDMEKFAYNKESLLNPHFVCRGAAIKDVAI